MNQMTREASDTGSGHAEPLPPPKGGTSNTKFYAIIVVLIVVIAALAVVAATQAGRTTTKIVYKTPTGNTFGTSASQYGTPTAAIGEQYDFSITPNGYFNWATVYWGDGSSTTAGGGQGANLTFSHVYNSVGTFGIYYIVNFSQADYTNINSIYPVIVGYSSTSQQTQISPYIQAGVLDINYATSTNLFTNITQLFAFRPGASANFNVTAQAPGTNYEFGVINQSVYVYKGSNVVSIMQIPWTFSAAAGAYVPPSGSYLNLTNLAAGYYSVDIQTQTAMIDPDTGAILSGTHTTHSFYDIPVGPSVGVYASASAATGSLTREVIGTGGYKSLDPAIGYDIISYEIVINTLLPMFSYNGSSSSQFTAVLASKLPTIANGGINNNYNNWTVKATTATAGYNQTYTASVQPYENYTVFIRNNTVWQDGSPVTAYDVYYSLVRVLLFVAGSPGTPGWIQAQSLLPGDFYVSNTFWNITQNMTYDNTTNSITFHFQNPVSPSFFFETYGQTSGPQIISSKWLMEHGAGITWTPAGFQAYIAQGNQGSYNTYVQNHIFADGPYQIAYIIPGLETVLTANQNFISPGPYLPAAKIKTIYISYVQTVTNAFLAMKSGQAQIATIPSSNWNLQQQLEAAGIAQNVSLPTLTINWYSFNANVNISMMNAADPNANMPFDIFISLQARQTFAYAYNYDLYLNSQLGNDVYHVNFGQKFAGMLPSGMLYGQNVSELNATTSGVPYYNLAMAQSGWANFVNSSMGSGMGLTYAGGKDMYNGKTLDIPFFVLAGRPPDAAGAQTWGQNLQKIIPGFQFQVDQMTLVQLIGWLVAGQNPMPIAQAFWAPDYPYPSDYLVPMALPDPSAFFPGADAMTVAYFADTAAHPGVPASLLSGQIANLSAMYSDFNLSASNPGSAKQYYQAWNEMLINMSFYIYTYQTTQFWTFSTRLPASQFINYQSNVMTGGAADAYYNFFSYS